MAIPCSLFFGSAGTYLAVVVKAGQAFVEPPNVKMTGYNRSATEPLRLVIFYVSEPDTPFLDPLPVEGGKTPK